MLAKYSKFLFVKLFTNKGGIKSATLMKTLEFSEEIFSNSSFF